MSVVHDYQARIEKVQHQLTVEHSMLVTNLFNIRYLCGFTGSSAALLINKESAVLVTDGRYIEQAQAETGHVAIHQARSLHQGIGQIVATSHVEYEPTHVTVAQFDSLSAVLVGKTLRKSVFTIESMRRLKDASEIELITQACAVSTAALHALVENTLVGQSERAIARKLNEYMIERGADGPAFEAIVASGPNTAIPHHQPSERTLGIGDLLKIDFGALVQGYHADCTRTFVAGTPTTWQRETYDSVYSSNAAATAMVADGVESASVDQCARGVLDSMGRLDEFVHGLGHGVGLAIHEDPFLSASDGTRLTENMVITVEPGLYVPGVGGVRIEDTLVVTTQGSCNLTVFPYELMDIS